MVCNTQLPFWWPLEHHRTRSIWGGRCRKKSLQLVWMYMGSYIAAIQEGAISTSSAWQALPDMFVRRPPICKIFKRQSRHRTLNTIAEILQIWIILHSVPQMVWNLPCLYKTRYPFRQRELHISKQSQIPKNYSFGTTAKVQACYWADFTEGSNDLIRMTLLHLALKPSTAPKEARVVVQPGSSSQPQRHRVRKDPAAHTHTAPHTQLRTHTPLS